jgi:hypothetical protein
MKGSDRPTFNARLNLEQYNKLIHKRNLYLKNIRINRYILFFCLRQITAEHKIGDFQQNQAELVR